MACPKNSEFIKNANINCSFEHGHELVDKYWEKELNKIKDVNFPYPDISAQSCIKELESLRGDLPFDLNSRGQSKIIRKFHTSMYEATRGNKPSPKQYWEEIKTNTDLFKDFLFNRLTRSDWFKTHPTELENADVPINIYFCGLTTSGKAPVVSYFKPRIAKSILSKYASDYDTIFDPFSGYSGRMIGAVSCGKNYIGQDINPTTVQESNSIYDFINSFKGFVKVPNVSITQKDIFESNGKYDCLFTCSPYGDVEKWNFDKDGNCIDKGLSCEDWIKVCLERFDCKRYIFVTDESCGEFEKYSKDKIENKGYWGKTANKNFERIIVIDN